MTFDRQKAFDTAVKGLLKQGKRAMTEGGGCAYRNEQGHKCAVGFLIPDKKYNPEMEGDTITGKSALILPVIGATRDDLTFLTRLQGMHDQSYDPEPGSFLPQFVDAAREVAETFNLNTKVLDNVGT